MKHIFYLIGVVLLVSCKSGITVINNTNETIEKLVVLTEEDQSDLKLGYRELLQKNILSEGLRPKNEIKIDLPKGKLLSAVAFSEDFNEYYKYNISKDTLILNRSIFIKGEEIIAETEPNIITLNVENNSDYIINSITVSLKRLGARKPIKKDVLHSWSLILPNQKSVIEYDPYVSSIYKLQSITITGFKNEDVYTKKFDADLNKTLVFSKPN